MEDFMNDKLLSSLQVKEIEELLKITDNALRTDSVILKGGSNAAKVVGTVIGGSIGASLAAAGTVGTFGVGSAALGIVSITAGVAVLPITIIGIIGAGIGMLIGRNKKKAQERKKQAALYEEVVKKQNELYKEYEEKKKAYEEQHAKDQETIRKQQEKLREYELIFEALKKKRDQMNAAFA
jgi:3-hydroxy-3-methylglutaryl CoA synthase